MKKILVVLTAGLIAATFAAVVPAAAQQTMSAAEIKKLCQTKAKEAFANDKTKRKEARKRCIESGGKNL